MTRIHHFPNNTELAKHLTQAIVSNINELLRKQNRVTLAVSGGKSPITLFQTLSQQSLDWTRVRITLVDERIVPTYHEASNTRLVREYLLQNQAASAQFIPLINDSADESCLKDSTQVLAFARQHFCPADIVVLGMGEDGHTASLFPMMSELSNASLTLLYTRPQNAPYERISMSFAAIKQAKWLYLSIAGEKKHATFQKACEKPDLNLPISDLLHDKHIDLNVYYHQ